MVDYNVYNRDDAVFAGGPSGCFDPLSVALEKGLCRPTESLCFRLPCRSYDPAKQYLPGQRVLFFPATQGHDPFQGAYDLWQKDRLYRYV